MAYVTFEASSTASARAENIIRSLEAELYFYGAVFGFTPADRIDPVRNRQPLAHPCTESFGPTRSLVDPCRVSR